MSPQPRHKMKWLILFLGLLLPLLVIVWPQYSGSATPEEPRPQEGEDSSGTGTPVAQGSTTVRNGTAGGDAGSGNATPPTDAGQTASTPDQTGTTKTTGPPPVKGATAKVVPPAPRPQVDCYGDPLPEGAVARIGTVRFHAGRTPLMVFSPDGRLLATHSYGTVEFWDGDGRRYAEIEMPEDERRAHALAFSPDTRLLVTGVGGQEVIAWNVENGRRIWKRSLSPYGDPTESVAFSPDGRRIAVGVHNRTDGVAILDAETGKVLQEIECKGFTKPKVDWFPDGQRILAVSFSKARIISLANPEEAKVTELPTQYGDPCLLADEGRLIVMKDRDRAVRVCDAGTFEKVLEVGAYRKVQEIVLDGGHKALIAGNLVIRDFAMDGDRRTLFVFLGEHQRNGYGEVQVYDLPSRRKLRELSIWISSWDCFGAVVTPDGQAIVTGVPDVRWWNALDGKPLNRRERHASRIQRLIFDPSGETLYSLGHGEAINTWSVRTGKHKQALSLTEKGTHFEEPCAMALTRDGRWLGVADERSNLGLLDNETGQVRSTMTYSSDLLPCDLMFSSDERQLVMLDWKIGFYDLKDGRVAGKPRQLECGKASYLTARFARSPDNRWLVANAEKVCLYDLEKMEEWGEKQSRPSPDYYGGAVLFSPDGKELIFGYDWKKNVVLRWRFQEEAYPWSKPVFYHDAPALAMSSEGLWATGMPRAKGGRIHGIKMAQWGADGWLREFRGHRFPVTALAFSTDGRYLASGDTAGEILIWDTQAQPEQIGVPPGEF